MKKTIYYAHSMHLYGKPQEQRDIVLLRERGFAVINPSDERHKKGFKVWTELYPDREYYMDYFENLVAFTPTAPGLHTNKLPLCGYLARSLSDNPARAVVI